MFFICNVITTQSWKISQRLSLFHYGKDYKELPLGGGTVGNFTFFFMLFCSALISIKRTIRQTRLILTWKAKCCAGNQSPCQAERWLALVSDERTECEQRRKWLQITRRDPSAGKDPGARLGAAQAPPPGCFSGGMKSRGPARSRLWTHSLPGRPVEKRGCPG